MCLAIYKPKGELFPTTEILSNAWGNNPHGAGIAIARKNGVEIIKGIMSFNDLVKVLGNVELIDEHVVLHFRWSTSGTIIPELTHPFPVSNKNSEILALNLVTEKAIIHNGVMFNPLTNSYSDTAIFSRYLAMNKTISEKQIKKILGDDRLVMIHKDKIKLLGAWSKVDGLHYSNLYSTEAPRASWSNLQDFDSWLDSNYGNVKTLSPSDDYSYDPYDDECEYCPFCDSDNVEYIGVKTKTFECLSCSTVYNETDMLISKYQFHKNVMPKLKKVK